MSRYVTVIIFGLFLVGATASSASAQPDTGTHVMSSDVSATAAKSLARLRETGGPIADLVIRHVDVGKQNLGVSVVSRTSREAGGELRGIVHVEIDEVYYVLEGEGTMVMGGEIEGLETRDSALLGPIGGALMTGGGVSRDLKPGDIAIVPKGVPHAWSEITTETITYLIVRPDPKKVMALK